MAFVELLTRYFTVVVFINGIKHRLRARCWWCWRRCWFWCRCWRRCCSLGGTVVHPHSCLHCSSMTIVACGILFGPIVSTAVHCLPIVLPTPVADTFSIVPAPTRVPTFLVQV